MAYYSTNHIPMVRHLLGSAVKNVAVEQGTSGQAFGSRPAYLAMGRLCFDSVEAFQAAFGPHAEVIMNDIANYTNFETDHSDQRSETLDAAAADVDFSRAIQR